MSARHALRALFATACAAMLGLAAGALWMVATLYLRHRTPWLALPFAVVLGAAIRHWVQAPGRGAAVLAALATLLAALYVSLLTVGVLVGASMGLGLLDALRTAGLSMLLQLARLGLSTGDVAWSLAAAAVAAVIAARPGRRAPRP